MSRRILLLVLCIGALNASPAATLTFTGGGGSIPDFDTLPGVITSDIVVTDPEVLAALGNNVTVTLLGLQHEYSGDLTVTLTYIGGVTLSGDIFNQIGIVNFGDPGYPAMFGDALFNYAFRSDFAGDLWGTAAPLGSADFIPGGEYWTSEAVSGAANNLSSMFNLLPAAATWRLTITDNAALGIGSFTGWQLDLEVESPVPEPSVAAMMGIAALAVLARWISRKVTHRAA